MPREVLIRPAGPIPRQSTGFIGSDDSVISESLSYLETHAFEPIGVDDVACHVVVSRRTLERRFQEAIGHSVAQEIRRLRIERAKQLLLDSGLTLAHIADQSGFRNAQSLSEAFKREVGMSPSEFRSFGRAKHRR